MIAYPPPRENPSARVKGLNAGRLGDSAFRRMKSSSEEGFILFVFSEGGRRIEKRKNDD
jgi:hypothetical protein